MATQVSTAAASARAKPSRRAPLPWWSAQAWGAIGAVVLFLAITRWWLAEDHSIPVLDAGRHLGFAFFIYEQLGAGHLTHALTLSFPYPPLAYLVGDLGVLVGGVDVSPPIIAENLVFVPLLALGCYHVGRMAFNRTAGLLAVVFALGTPAIVAQFHIFLIDPPETAMVAVSLWAILASDGFTRVGVSALAGVAVGLGMLTKEPFVLFVAGPVLVTAIRGRMKAWRGLLAFALVALAIALPWYLHELRGVESIGSGAISEPSDELGGADVSPPPLSIDNLEWYFWSLANSQQYLPLLAFSVIGWVWTIVGFARRRAVSRFAAELAIGAFVAWLAITETFVRDPRYCMPLLVYLAVFGAGWVTRLPRAGRRVAVSTLILVCAANVVGAGFGVGRQVRLYLPGANADFLQSPGVLTLYSNGGGSLGSGPHGDGDMLAALRGLKRDGVQAVILERSTESDEAFSAPGMFTLDGIAGLGSVLADNVAPERLSPRYALLRNAPIEAGEAPPCVRLANGTGVWIRLGGVQSPETRDFCPSRDARPDR